MSAPAVLDMLDEWGLDTRGRKRRAGRAAGIRARAAARLAGAEEIGEGTQRVLAARLNKVGGRGRAGTPGEVVGRGDEAMRMFLEERHRSTLASVERAKGLPMSLQEVAMRAGLN